jgi:hypothetical protein
MRPGADVLMSATELVESGKRIGSNRGARAGVEPSVG